MIIITITVTIAIAITITVTIAIAITITVAITITITSIQRLIRKDLSSSKTLTVQLLIRWTRRPSAFLFSLMLYFCRGTQFDTQECLSHIIDIFFPALHDWKGLLSDYFWSK